MKFTVQSGSVKVVEEPQAEQGEWLEDPEFNDTSKWTKNTGVTVSEGQALFSNVSDKDGVFAEAIHSFEVGKSYQVITNVESITSGALEFYIAGSGLSPQLQSLSAGINIMKITTEANPSKYCKIRASVDSTTAKINSFSVTEIQAIPVGAKSFEQETDGVTSIPSDKAYGTWEFGANHITANHTGVFLFLSTNSNTTGNGYYLVVGGNGEFYLRVRNSGSTGDKLFETADSYILNNNWYDYKIERLASSGVFKDVPTLQTSDLANSNYTSFTEYDNLGFDAVSNGGSTMYCGTADEITITNTKTYKIEFDLVLNSGTAPQILLMQSLGSGTRSNIVQTAAGRNEISLVCTGTETGVVAFRNNTAVPGDYKVRNLRTSQVYDVGTFAVFIKSPTDTNFPMNKWTLVDVTGGSGTNPVTDNTYTTSKYLVTDMDSGDKIKDITINRGVQQ